MPNIACLELLLGTKGGGTGSNKLIFANSCQWHNGDSRGP